MQAIPVKVTDVNIFVATHPGGQFPKPILVGASGTYSFGSFLTNLFYNLDLDKKGRQSEPLTVHGKYVATGKTASGHSFITPWMYCTAAGDDPKLGRTITVGGGEHPVVGAVAAPMVQESHFIKLGPLHEITVSQLFPKPAIGQQTLISNGAGYVIATRYGTPHEMGVQVDSGERTGSITAGMKRIIISGKTQDGHQFTQEGLTVISSGDPAIFLKIFP